MPGKRSSFWSPVEPISPPPKPACRHCGLGWRRRVLPPGPKDLFRRPFIAIAALADGKRNIGDRGPGGKGAPTEGHGPRDRGLAQGIMRLILRSLCNLGVLCVENQTRRPRGFARRSQRETNAHSPPPTTSAIFCGAGHARTDQGPVADDAQGRAGQDRAKVVDHARTVALKMAEGAISKDLFADAGFGATRRRKRSFRKSRKIATISSKKSRFTGRIPARYFFACW